MSRSKKAVGIVVLFAGWMMSHPAPEVQATDVFPLMIWMPTSDYLQCDQNGPAPECADYGTPTGDMVQMTCCVSRDALGTTDRSACTGTTFTRGRTEL